MSIQAAIERLGDDLRAGNLVLFCGAGISAGSVPLAREFLLGHGFSNLSWRQALSLLERDAKFRREFARVFGVANPTDVHRWLANLNVTWYVTTNYDRLLETALIEHHGADQVAIITRDSDLTRAAGRRCVCLKLHGDVEITELLVMTSRDYRERMRRPRRVDALLRYLLATHPTLFIGSSLDEENVIDMLEEDEKNVPAPPRRYLLQMARNSEQETYLESLGVEALCIEDIQAGAVTEKTPTEEFLKRLWEQTSPFGDFLFHNDRRTPSVAERIDAAIDLRRRGDLEAARQELNAIRAEARIPLNQLPRLLWLTVSLYDKLERLTDFDTLEPEVTRWLQGVRNAPASVQQAVFAAYHSALAIAYLRASRFAQALELSQKASAWCPSREAQPDFHILHANLLTIRAMAVYCDWVRRMSRDKGDIEAARQCLNAAWDVYSLRGDEDGAESHHLGRYFGTRAFVETALADSGATGSVEEYAYKAHNDGGNRTRFGTAAGLYCHAFVLWRLHSGEADQRVRAVGMLDRAAQLIPESGALARQRLAALRAQITGDEKSLAALRKQLDPALVKHGLDVGTWLQLPLN